ncbi:MAG: hypothetical protein E6I45_10720 [Chloroflexi bacterium]|nr:MAG: hypothetical protein E6I45_10720 [Chloroflexota bacterium]
MFEPIAEQVVAITLYTDVFVVRGKLPTRQRRLSDILNATEHDFIVLQDVVIDEFGSRTQPIQSEFAQVNLATVLFGVGDTVVEALPELRTIKIPEQALISVPPFRITGQIHLLPERDLREALGELTGRFLPVTQATYWSELVGEAKQTAPMVAINHSRAQILAPHREVDPWAGLDRAAGAAGESEAAVAGDGHAQTGVPDPWGERTPAQGT